VDAQTDGYAGAVVIALFLLCVCLLLGLTAFGLVRAWRRTPLSSHMLSILFVLWLAALVFLTMRPTSGRAGLNTVPLFLGGPGSARDGILNAALFVPLGLLLASADWRIGRVFGVAFALSLTVEMTQYFFVSLGRKSDVNDLIFNVAGAAIGWTVSWAIRRHRRGTAEVEHLGPPTELEEDLRM
jgi:glycopeptide antibiotics resistance protein